MHASASLSAPDTSEFGKILLFDLGIAEANYIYIYVFFFIFFPGGAGLGEW